MLSIVATQVGVVMTLVLRNAWVKARLIHRSDRSKLLARLYDELGAETSPLVRAELVRRTIRADLATLEQWLDLVARRGLDPAELPAAEYEHAGLVDRYLRELLRARRWTRRAAAAAVLGWTGSPRAVPSLLEVALDVRGEAAPVRAAALHALERIRHADAVPALVASLSSFETWFTPRAAAVLVRIGEDAMEPLLRELTDHSSSASTRRWAASILGQIGDRRALRALHGALGDVDPELRAHAAKALGRLRDPSSVQPLLDRLITDPSPFVRTAVAQALGRLPTRETIAFLARSLSDPEWWVRLSAVESLANLGHPAVNTLRAALRDHDAGVAREAARGLERIGAVADALDVLRRKGYEPEASEFLIDVGRAGSLDALLDALRDSDAALVTIVVRILARIGNRSAGGALAELISSRPDPSLQARVVDALLKIRAGGHAREVASLIRSHDEWVRRGAIAYVEAFGEAWRLPPMDDLLADADAGVRCAALRLVERLRPPAAIERLVIARLDDVDSAVRAQAFRTLASRGRYDVLLARGVGTAPDDAIRETVGGLAADGSADSVRVALALFSRVSERDLERLAEVVRAAASQRADDVAAIASSSDDPAARWAAATAPLVTATAPALPLEALAQDDDPRVRAAALPALLHRADDPGRARRLVARATADRSPLVAASAVRALAFEDGLEIGPRLEVALRTAEPRVAADVAFAIALRRPLSGRHLQVVHSRGDAETSLAATCGRIHQGDLDALPDWLAALRDEASARILGRWHQDRHPLFARMIANASEPNAPLERRLLAAPSAYAAEMEVIQELDGNPDEDVRLLCVNCLRPLQSRKAEGILLSTSLRDPSARVRSAALGLLVAGPASGDRLGLIENALRDPDEGVQVAAAQQASTLEAAEAIPLLVRHLETAKPRFLTAIVDELARRNAPDGAVLRAVLARPVTEPLLRGLVAVLARTDAPLTPDVTDRFFDHRWPAVRAAAIRALAARIGENGGGRVLQALRDPAASVRLAALRACSDPAVDFRGREGPRAQAIIAALADPSPRPRVRAARAAATLHLQEARDALRLAAHDHDHRVARAADDALRLLAAPSSRNQVAA